MKKKILLYILSFFIITNLLSQKCDVNVNSLKGDYTGHCKRGKAEGKGSAIGIDSYTGDFKNGYPDGEGKYIWKNGSWYQGFWKNGLFDGKGTLKKINTPDSMVIVSGFWKKGKYIGQYEKPFIIHSITNNITDVNVRKLNTKESDITLTVKNITGGASSLSSSHLPKTRLTDIQVIEGRFDQKISDETSSPIANKYTLQKITYPFYAIFSFETIGTQLQVEKVGIELLASGMWYIQVNIDN